MDMPTNVLIAHRASAPAPSTARAITPMSVTIGVSFTHTGRVVRLRTASVTAAAARGSLPKYRPPCSTLGQEMFDLEACDSWHPVEPRDQISVLGYRLPVDVHQHREVPRRPLGRVVANQSIHAWALKADGVQHPLSLI